MSVPFSFITAPSVLTRASDAVESATTDSFQKAECVVPNARQDHVKKPKIPYLRKRVHSTARIAARSQIFSTIPSPQCRAVGDPRQGAIYLQNKYSSCYSAFIRSVDFAGVSLSGAAQSSNSSALCADNVQDSSECESPSDFSATSASDFHHCSMLSMLQKLGPALNQVKACQWQQLPTSSGPCNRRVATNRSSSSSTDGTDS